jgi:lipoate-protein ligase A
MVGPDSQLWLDVFLPAGDPLSERDVGKAFTWLGAAAAGAISSVTGGPSETYAGPLLATRWSPMLCFCGLGTGEVLVEGRKVLGVSQRRVRAGATFRLMVLLQLDAAASASVLALGSEERRLAAEHLGGFAAPVEADPRALEEALLAAVCGAERVG